MKTKIKVEPKIIYVFFFEKFPNVFVIKDLFATFKTTSSWLERNCKSEGIKKNVTEMVTIYPIVIIQPKSMIGVIPLNIKDKKAQIVVSTV